MTRLFGDGRLLAALATGGSAALLLGALGFQHLGGLAPCPLCIWQRWPHAIVIGLGLSALLLWRWRGAAVLLAAAALVEIAGAALGAFHAGVERGWWEGPTTCVAAPVGGLSTDDLMARIMAAPLVRCDEIVWEFLGLTMAGWNALISLGLAAGFALALRAYASSSASQ